MIDVIQQLNHVLAICGILGIGVIAFVIFDLQTKQRLASLIRTWGLTIALIAATGSTMLTLVYSEIFGLIPCGLCWLERVAVYPQILLLGTALYLKDKAMPFYGIALSSFGLLVSLYHHYIQMGGSEFIKCPAAGADCTKRFLFEFNFITFPFLSVILFVFLITLYLYILKVQKD